MSGFVGAFHREAPVTAALLERMWAPIEGRGPDSSDRWLSGTMGVAAGVLRVTPESRHEVQPHVHRSGVVAVFDGRLDNRSQVLSALPGGALDSREPDVALIAAAYVAWGDRFPERLKGEYALAVLDPSSRRVLLALDPVGTRSLVFGRSPSGDVVFGSEAKALFAHNGVESDPNLDVLAEYLLGGNARATPWDTFFSGIRRVPPGVTVLARDGGVTWRTHDRLPETSEPVLRAYEDYVDEYRELFDQSITRRSRSEHPIGVFISGGVDSSSVLAVAATHVTGDARLVPVNISFADSPADEEVYVRMLESELGVTIERIDATGDDLVAATSEQSRILEAPVSSAGWDSRVAAWRLLHRRGAKSYLGGHWGDQVLVDQSYLVDLFDHLRWSEVRKHLAEYPAWMLGVPESFFRRMFVEDLIRWHLPQRAARGLRVVRARLRGGHHEAGWYTETLRKRAAAPPLRPLLGGWSRAPIRARLLRGRLWGGFTSGISLPWNGIAASRFELDALAPFLDRDLLAFLMAVPGEVLTPSGRFKGLHRDAMIGLVPEDIRQRRDKGDGTADSNVQTIDAIPKIVELFSEDPVSGRMDLVHPEVLSMDAESLKERLADADDFTVGEMVTRVLALEVWLRSF